MGFFNELAKLFKGKPPERHGAHGVTKEIKVAKRLEEIQDKERIKEIERDRERAKERRNFDRHSIPFSYYSNFHKRKIINTRLRGRR